MHRSVRPTLAGGVVLLASLLVRLWVAFFSGLPWWSSDTYGYMTMAEAIRAHHPMALLPNGYPLLIAGVMLVLKASLVPATLITINVVLSTLSVWLVMQIGHFLTGEKMAALAGLMLAIYPNQINYTRLLLSETPTAFLLVLTLFLLFRGQGLAAGLVAVLCGLFRSTLTPIVPLILLVCISTRRQWKGYLAGVVLGLGGYVALLVAGVVASSTNVGVNLLLAVHSYSHRISFATSGFTPDQIAHPLWTYLSFAIHAPVTFASQRLDALWELWGPWPLGADRGIGAKMLIGLRCPLLLLAGYGVWQRRDFATWLLVLPVLSVTATHVAFFAAPRFSFVVEPCLILLAVCGFAAAVGAQTGKQFQRLNAPFVRADM